MVIGVSLILLGAFGLIIPFIGPLFGFGMGPDPAWVWTTQRFVRHVIPGAAVITGGILLLPRYRSSRNLGATLALLGGAWFVLAPIVLGRGGEPQPALIDILRPAVYHFGLGTLIAALAGFGIGRWTARPVEQPEAPYRTREFHPDRTAGQQAPR